MGKNGSGKSTILKLVSRLYDPVEGEILIDGYDIRSLKLADLRKAIAVLFQDYTHFSLSVRQYRTALLYGSLILPLTMVRFATTSHWATPPLLMTTITSDSPLASRARKTSSTSFQKGSIRISILLYPQNTQARPRDRRSSQVARSNTTRSGRRRA